MEASVATAQNRYLADLRDFNFLLFEQFRLGEMLADPRYGGMDEDAARMVLDESYAFVKEVLGPLNEVGDRHGCRIENGANARPNALAARPVSRQARFSASSVPCVSPNTTMFQLPPCHKPNRK